MLSTPCARRSMPCSTLLKKESNSDGRALSAAVSTCMLVLAVGIAFFVGGNSPLSACNSRAMWGGVELSRSLSTESANERTLALRTTAI